MSEREEVELGHLVHGFNGSHVLCQCRGGGWLSRMEYARHVAAVVRVEERDPSEGDVEALAEELYGRGGGIFWRGEESWQGHYLEAASDVLASDWLAAHDERVRESERERLAGEMRAGGMMALVDALVGKVEAE